MNTVKMQAILVSIAKRGAAMQECAKRQALRRRYAAIQRALARAATRRAMQSTQQEA